MNHEENEDLVLLDKVLFPLGIAVGLFGMGLGLGICIGLF